MMLTPQAIQIPKRELAVEKGQKSKRADEENQRAQRFGLASPFAVSMVRHKRISTVHQPDVSPIHTAAQIDTS
eukprot:CAMPEP_0119401728 /NCGR_PEP_ID=MMETSP1334-20130426/142520_1 /TAXON_ID=127549 /ORGANISM="Calcidiscus leptoporus, Strain RCC1130" /LENGTH=72 /DNA_ID=CAMNT_0007425651 /DNA_START=215 /DNA_END=433 /DNA_ORIENTATION=+